MPEPTHDAAPVEAAAAPHQAAPAPAPAVPMSTGARLARSASAMGTTPPPDDAAEAERS